MVTYWIFRAKLFDNAFGDDEVTLSWSHNRRFLGHENDKVLILDDKGGEHFFNYSYSIESVSNTSLEDKEANNKVNTKVILRLNQAFEKPKNLSNYIYSILRVTNYRTPFRHFTQKYSRLSKDEFNGIVTDEIYFTRTILGTLLNALPREHQEGYLAFLAWHEPELLRRNVDIEAALSYAIRYAKYAIIKPAECMRSGAEILRRVTQGGLETIGFAEGDSPTDQTYWIQPQLSNIEQYLSEMKNLLSAASEQVAGTLGSDSVYQESFKKLGLPMSLKRQPK